MKKYNISVSFERDKKKEKENKEAKRRREIGSDPMTIWLWGSPK